MSCTPTLPGAANSSYKSLVLQDAFTEYRLLAWMLPHNAFVLRRDRKEGGGVHLKHIRGDGELQPTQFFQPFLLP